VRGIRAWFGRVRLPRWLHFLPLPLATFDPHAPRGAAVLAAVRGVAIAFTILAYGYLLNSVADRRTDRDARKNPFIAPGAGEYQYSLTVLIAASLLLAGLSPWPARLATLACLVLGYLYSMGPRLKSIPIASTLANVCGFTALLLVGVQGSSLPPLVGYLALSFAALLLQNQLIHEAADRHEDQAGGVRTTWLTLGPSWTTVIVTLSGCGAALAGSSLAGARSVTVLALVGAIFGVVFPFLLVSRGAEANYAARLRIVHRWCSAACGAGLFTAWRWST